MPTQELTPEIIAAAIQGYEAQKTRIDQQIAELRSLLAGGRAEPAATPEGAPRKRRNFSAATRRRMKETQQRRWAKIRGASEPATPEAPKPKRKLSAAGREAIQEALRRRWALKRAEAAKAAPKKIDRKKAAVKKAAPAKAAKKSAPVKKPAEKIVQKTAPAPAPAVEQTIG